MAYSVWHVAIQCSANAISYMPTMLSRLKLVVFLACLFLWANYCTTVGRMI